jgi:UDP-glucose 4-epimerase
MRPGIKDSRILVTGGAGFIGSHLVDRLLFEGAGRVVVVDNMFLGSEENLSSAISKGAVLYKEDAEIASSLEYIFEKHRIDIVFNAATKALNYSFVNPKNALETNVNVALNLLELQRRKAFKSLCHFSTSEVYGTAVYEPMDEAHPMQPTTAYAAGKAAADIAIQTYVRMFDVDAFIVRPFNNYGPRQNYNGFMAGVIPVTAWRILNGMAPEIHGTGTQSRDFIYVSDTVDAIVNLYGLVTRGDAVNISADGQIPIETVIVKIAAALGFEGKIHRKPNRGSDVLCHNASNSKAQSLYAYPLTPFDEGLAKTLEWYRDRFSGLPKKSRGQRNDAMFG